MPQLLRIGEAEGRAELCDLGGGERGLGGA